MGYIELEKPIKTKFTGDTAITTIMVTKYPNHGGALAMMATTDECKPIANITVNLPESMFLDDNCFFLEAGQAAKAIKDFWLKEGIIKKIDDLMAVSGFTIYDAYEIVDPILKDKIRKAINND